MEIFSSNRSASAILEALSPSATDDIFAECDERMVMWLKSVAQFVSNAVALITDEVAQPDSVNSLSKTFEVGLDELSFDMQAFLRFRLFIRLRSLSHSEFG
jgi:hypothetical protein